jgi:hypothetical protein
MDLVDLVVRLVAVVAIVGATLAVHDLLGFPPWLALATGVPVGLAVVVGGVAILAFVTKARRK